MNRAIIQRTTFTNHPNNEKTFGYCIYDDYGQSYNNVMDEQDMTLSPPSFLAKAKETFDDVADSIFDGAVEHGGIYIDDDWYELTKTGKLKNLKCE